MIQGRVKRALSSHLPFCEKIGVGYQAASRSWACSPIYTPATSPFRYLEIEPFAFKYSFS